MNATRITFSAEVTISLQPREISLLMACRKMHKLQHCRVATNPGGFIHEAHQKYLQNPQKDYFNVEVTKFQLQSILDLLENTETKDPYIDDLKCKTKNIIDSMIYQEKEVSGKAFAFGMGGVQERRRLGDRRKAEAAA